MMNHSPVCRKKKDVRKEENSNKTVVRKAMEFCVNDKIHSENGKVENGEERRSCVWISYRILKLLCFSKKLA